MIIKIMPENEFERQSIQEVEHTGVKEFFMFGNKKEMDGDLIDFYDWKGSYKYLEGNIYHYLTTITNEKNSKSQQTNEISLQPQGQIKPPMIKKGMVDNPNVKVIDVEELSKKIQTPPTGTTIPFPFPPVTDEFVETPVEDENLEAEDKE